MIRGATVMKGYWEKPEATAKKLRPGPLPGEQVLYTGDFCRLDEEGYLYFVGRMDDIIKSRGEKVAPKEVENALMNIPGVKEAAVIGVPDEILGQAVKAFVVLEQGVRHSSEGDRPRVPERLENFMVPEARRVRRRAPEHHHRQDQEDGAFVSDPSGRAACRVREILDGHVGDPLSWKPERSSPRRRYRRSARLQMATERAARKASCLRSRRKRASWASISSSRRARSFRARKRSSSAAPHSRPSGDGKGGDRAERDAPHRHVLRVG